MGDKVHKFRNILLFVNGFTFVLGCIILLIGIARKMNIGFVNFISDLIVVTPTWFMIIGGLMVFISYFGFYGAYKYSPCFLYTYALVVLTLALIKLGFFFYVQSKSSDPAVLEAKVSSTLGNLFENYNSSALAQESFDSLEVNFVCCGVNGSKDYADHNLSIPMSCCSGGEEGEQSASVPPITRRRRHLFLEVYEENGDAGGAEPEEDKAPGEGKEPDDYGNARNVDGDSIEDEARDDAPEPKCEKPHEQGCVKPFTEALQSRLSTISLASILLPIIEIILAFFAIYLAKHPPGLPCPEGCDPDCPCPAEDPCPPYCPPVIPGPNIAIYYPNSHAHYQQPAETCFCGDGDFANNFCPMHNPGVPPQFKSNFPF